MQMQADLVLLCFALLLPTDVAFLFFTNRRREFAPAERLCLWRTSEISWIRFHNLRSGVASPDPCAGGRSCRGFVKKRSRREA